MHWRGMSSWRPALAKDTSPPRPTPSKSQNLQVNAVCFGYCSSHTTKMN